MSFPCSSWIIFSSKCLEKEMLKSFILPSEHAFSPLQDKIKEALEQYKESAVLKRLKNNEKINDEDIAQSLMDTLDYFINLSEKSSQDDFFKALNLIAIWKRLGFLKMDASFLVELRKLEIKLEDLCKQAHPNLEKKLAALKSIEALMVMLSEKSTYKKQEKTP
jgi:hypothetical protein